jgi:glycosyltransferase involved in cell wall biosynthesis
VVIPAYNCEAYLGQAVDSVLAQDYPHKEVIVVNDGSRDGTLAVARRYDGRIRIVDQPNAGPPAARNAGIAAARGEYIAFIDADDVWVQGKLSAQVREMKRDPQVSTVFTDWHRWYPQASGQFVLPLQYIQSEVSDVADPQLTGWIYHLLLQDCHLLTSTVMMRRTLLDHIGLFDLDFWNGDDYDMWLRAAHEAKVVKLASVGTIYRILPGSVSRKPVARNYELEVIQTALKRFGAAGPGGQRLPEAVLQERLRRLEAQHAFTHLNIGDARLACDIYRRLLAREPWRLSYWVRGAQALVKARA